MSFTLSLNFLRNLFIAMPLCRRLLFFLPAFLFKFSAAQNNSPVTSDLTVSYSIELKSGKKNAGIAETYNGALKTLFLSGDSARIRLVSLMRTQSIFVFPENKERQTAAVVKESGKDKYKFYLTAGEWKRYNEKYDGAVCMRTNDTAYILNYLCRKAIISLKDGRTIEAYYTETIKRKGQGQVEPLFACVPGLVLKYAYTSKKGKVIYTATSIAREKIDPEVFHVPSNGVIVKKISAGMDL